MSLKAQSRTQTDNSIVSVIIPTYNYGKYIAEAVASALDQRSAPYEVIVVDDGSTDDTAAVVRSFGDRVSYLRQENAGVCAATNRGVVKSSG
jgi:glycosyltransferase involved in cell wall biosynthesis